MKKHMKVSLLLAVSLTLVIGLAAGIAAEGETGSYLAIKVAGLGAGVENRTLVGTGDIFPEGSKVYFFTWVLGGQAGDHVTHVWLHGEEEKFTIDLAVGGPSWRTWSNKTMHPGSVGNWRVEVRDASGNVLDGMSFECTAATIE